MKEEMWYKIIIIMLVCSITINIIQAIPKQFIESIQIESELEKHLETKYDSIIIRNINVINKDLDGWWHFRIYCMNIEEEIMFFEDCRFNPETKELIGYNVLNYMENPGGIV